MKTGSGKKLTTLAKHTGTDSASPDAVPLTIQRVGKPGESDMF